MVDSQSESQRLASEPGPDGALRGDYVMNLQVEPKLSRKVKYSHYINLPKTCVSPTGSIYKWYDIVYQEHVLVRMSSNHKGRIDIRPSIIRSRGKFTIKVLVGKKIKFIDSKSEW